MERRAFLKRIAVDLPPPDARVPHPEPDLDALSGGARDLRSELVANARAVDAEVLEGLDALGRWLHQTGRARGVVEPGLAGLLLDRWPGIELEVRTDRAAVTQAELGIGRAVGAIASTGSLVLDDGQGRSRLGALAPWVHVALLDPIRIHPGLPAALARLGEAPGVVWVTGPSKTADVEGIMIHGAHGPGVQVICLVEDLDRLVSEHAAR